MVIFLEEHDKKIRSQFSSALGLQISDNDPLEYLKEINKWLREMKDIGNKYLEYLQELGLHYQYSNVAEVGKGVSDSIVVNKSRTTIISPYISLEDRIKNPLLPAELIVDINGVPILRFKTTKHIPVYQEMVKLFFSIEEVMLMTHNPYCQEAILNWAQLSNGNSSKIIVGVFGNTHDKNMLIKMKAIKFLYGQILNDCLLKYATDSDHYFYVLASNQYRKK